MVEAGGFEEFGLFLNGLVQQDGSRNALGITCFLCGCRRGICCHFFVAELNASFLSFILCGS
jgi:hypothetical protein